MERLVCSPLGAPASAPPLHALWSPSSVSLVHGLLVCFLFASLSFVPVTWVPRKAEPPPQCCVYVRVKSAATAMPSLLFSTSRGGSTSPRPGPRERTSVDSARRPVWLFGDWPVAPPHPHPTVEPAPVAGSHAAWVVLTGHGPSAQRLRHCPIGRSAEPGQRPAVALRGTAVTRGGVVRSLSPCL